MISLNSLAGVVVYLIVAGLVWWLLWWLVSFVNPPEPFRKIATACLAVLAVLVVIGILLSLVGGQPLFRP